MIIFKIARINKDKVSINFVMSVRRPVSLSICSNASARIFPKFDIWDLTKICHENTKSN